VVFIAELNEPFVVIANDTKVLLTVALQTAISTPTPGTGFHSQEGAAALASGGSAVVVTVRTGSGASCAVKVQMSMPIFGMFFDPGTSLCSACALAFPNLSATSASRSTAAHAAPVGAANESAGNMDESKDKAIRLWRMIILNKLEKQGARGKTCMQNLIQSKAPGSAATILKTFSLLRQRNREVCYYDSEIARFAYKAVDGDAERNHSRPEVKKSK
jgi:hypothetical protein